jgi:hypothetical protein
MMALKTLRSRLGVANTFSVKPPPKRGDPLYDTKEWRDLMRRLFAVRGRRCEDPNCPTPHGPWSRIYGDHIIELRDGGAPLDEGNVLLRCPTCHGAKTASERGRRAARLS